MSKFKAYAISILVGPLLLLYSFYDSPDQHRPTIFKGKDTLVFEKPEGWPEPNYDFEKHPVTVQGFNLGRQLFYDPILSKDSTISCASCHLVFTNFTHVDHALSHGIEDRIGTRNTLTIVNPIWQEHFMWDGGVNHLEVQPLVPISHPDEMGSNLELVVDKLKRSPRYSQLFEKAFGKEQITGQHILQALAQFMATFISANSKYDKVMRNEPGITFTEREQKGLEVFRTHCESCHQEPLFTSSDFKNNGLPVDSRLLDGGRSKITHNDKDSLKFRVPTLRNIEVSYPYMHDGRFRLLQSVLFHYTEGIEHTPNLAPELQKPMVLTEDDKRNLLLFLKTLTDRDFLYNKDLRFPVNQ